MQAGSHLKNKYGKDMYTQIAINLLIDKYVGTYKTFEECRAASVAMLDNLNSREKGDYECGLNCNPKDGLNICDKTER